MPQFFIDRPVFAWVVALFISLFGILAIPKLPVARFPSIAPTSVGVTASYPGASAETVNTSIVVPLERELTGVKNLLYFTSSADSSGSASVNLTFAPGTDPELATVDVQNRLKAVEGRLPAIVRQNGLAVESASAGFLAIVTLASEGNRFSALDLEDYLAKRIVPELKRIKGVGRVQSFGTEKAMRIWIDPLKLEMLNLGISDVTAAIQSQSLQIAPGQIGSEPSVSGQQITVPLAVNAQLSTPQEFEEIVLKAKANGSTVLLKDVARVEIGAQTNSFSMQLNGKEATGAALQLSPGGNAVATADAVKARLAELKLSMPKGMTYALPFDTSPFVKVSIEKVVHTLIEAMALVFAVMFLFLQNIRYTLIPSIVAPVALLGTFAVMYVTGYTINVLTMFGMVLAIGIIVDDAIVVVENVERIMASEGLDPKAATRKAIREITGAVIGITAVLVAVFIPMAFASGSAGAIYRQFTLAMAVSILFSAFLALSLTPALCATILKPVSHDAPKWRIFRLFDRGVEALTEAYGRRVSAILGRSVRMLVVYGCLVAALLAWFPQLPSSFLPDEDQGNYMVSVTLPADATQARTARVTDRFNRYVTARPATDDNLLINGFSFMGQGANAAMAFVTMKDWADRPGVTVTDEVAAASAAMSDLPEGEVLVMAPPAIEELGGSSGFTFVLQDRAGSGLDALLAAKDKLVAAAEGNPKLKNVRQDALPSGPSVRLTVDRRKAQALGVSFTAIADTLSTAIGSTYIGDFPNGGSLQQIIVQADAPYRMQVDDVLKLFVRNNQGGMVTLSEVVSPDWTTAPSLVSRHNGYLAVNLTGEPATGVSSGQAMLEIEKLVKQLPEGFGIEWTGESLQERDSGAQMPMLLAISMLFVFLVLAALYESWTVPFSVMAAVPLGILGAVAAISIGGQTNDIFFKVGLITVIGLTAKNAILIVEFAKAKLEEGAPLREAIIEAARLRIRPIVMTSIAFALGVLPLVFARGASAETQKALGTGVLGGVIAATVLTLFFVPVFYQSVVRFFARRGKTTEGDTGAMPIAGDKQ